MSNFKIKATKLPKHTKEFEILVDWDKVSSTREKAFADLAADITAPGFRKGQAPKDIAARYMNPEKLYDRTGRLMLPDIYKELIDKEKIKPVTTPSVELIEAKENEPWKFKVTVAEIPDVKIKDYKKRVSEAHEKARQQATGDSKQDKKNKSEKAEDDKVAKPTESPQSPTLPQKASMSDIMKTIIELVEVEIPDLLTRDEVTKRMAKIREDVKKVGLTFEQYLESRKLNADELEAQYVKDVEEMYKLEFALAEIAKQEGIKVDESELEKMLAGAKTDKERQIIMQNMEWYEGIMRKQKVLDFLNDL